MDNVSIEERKKIARTAKLRVISELSDYVLKQCVELCRKALNTDSLDEFNDAKVAVQTYNDVHEKIVEIAERVYGNDTKAG